jgi:hypothetical protein
VGAVETDEGNDGKSLGGFGGIALVLGVRWSFRGKDAGSVRIQRIRARLRTPPWGEQGAPRAQPVFRQVLLGRAASNSPRRRLSIRGH